MATFVLLPGAASDSWYWHLVEPLLVAGGHRSIAVDLPCDDDAAGFPEYADTVVAAIDDRGARDAAESFARSATRSAHRAESFARSAHIVLVAQSMAGFTAPIVATRVPVAMIVLVAAMTPTAGESGADWWTNTGHGAAHADAMAALGLRTDPFDEAAVFLHDVPSDVAAEAARHLRVQSGTPFEQPWPLDAWPDVATRFLLCRDDRLFPAAFQRRVVRARLGITPDEMDGGHLPALAHPEQLAAHLLRYAAELTATPPT